MWNCANCAKCAGCAKCATHPPGVGPKICNAGQQRRLMTSESCQSHQSDHHHHDHCHTFQPNHMSQGGKTQLGFLVHSICVLCASVDPTFIFWGQKMYSLVSDGMFIISVQTTTTIARRGIWTELIHCYWSNTMITDHICLKPALDGRWKSYVLCNTLQSEPYICRGAMRCWGWG